MTFGIRGQLTDLITQVKFLVYQLQGLRSSDTTKLPFTTDFLRRPYNSVRTVVLHCDWKMECNVLLHVHGHLSEFLLA